MYIVSKRFDLTFIFGGATASLAVPFLVMWNPGLLPILFWIWLLVFDGTHLWAAYSRTYIDRQFWRTNKPLLIASPLVFLLPLSAVVLQQLSGSMKPIEIFLVFAQGWAYYHLVRQHYGFVSLYDRKAGSSRETHLLHKWALYSGLWIPYLYFIATHPINRNVAGLPPLEQSFHQAVTVAAIFLSAIAFILSFMKAGKNSNQEPAAVTQATNSLFTPASSFTGTCILLYSLIFYGIAPREPFWAGAHSVVQSFMLLAIMMTLFHNIQYHAIVWHYNRKKYRDESYGWAQRLNRNFPVYGTVALIFSSLYVATAWSSTEYPSLTGRLLTPAFIPAAFCIWWGVLFHHYYLDQKIWRFSRTPDLKQQLGMVA